VLEIVATDAAFVTVVGDERIGASAASFEGAHVCPIAPDELLVVAPPAARERLVSAAASYAWAVDDDALVLDSTDGWAVWTLRGDVISAAFSCVSAVSLPDRGFAQGDVARVPLKLIVPPPRLHLIVPAMWSEHLHRCIVERCRSFGLVELPGVVPFETSVTP